LERELKIAPKPDNEESRLRILRQYDVLDTLPEPDFDDIAFLASQICGTPVALVSMVDENRQWFKARRGLTASETPRDVAFCAHAILESGVLVVPDSTQDERFHDNPLVVGEPLVRFYAGAPLKTPDGQRIGTLCVIDHVPRQLSKEQIHSLEILSRLVMDHLEFRIKSESIRRAAKLLQDCPAAIFCQDYNSGKGTFVEWNDAAEELWSLKKQDVLGRTAFDIFPHEQAVRFRESDLQSLRLGQQVYIKQESIDTPKGRKELRTWKVPVSDAKGVPRFVLGISFDITQQIELEKQLHDARTKAENAARSLDLALEGASLGIWDWDLTTNQVNFDRRWCEMLGLSLEQTRMDLKTWEERVHPDDLAQCYKDIQSYIKGEQERYENIHRMQHANGEWVYILDRGRFSAWDINGKPIRFTGTHLDITALEKSKMELQDARRRLEEAEIAGRFGSWELNLITGESNWSRGHNHIFDFDSEQNAPSFEAFLSCLAPQENAKLQAIYQDMTLGKISHFDTDYRVLTKSGQLRYVKANGQVQYDGNHRPVSVIGTVQDITSLKLMEISLIESREEAISATKTKSRFLANMSHEIRTPLNGVIGSAVLLMETSLSAEQRELAQTIKSSSDSLLTLIEDILDFSKIEAGKLEIEMLPFDIRTTVRDAVNVISMRAAEKAVSVKALVDEKVPDVIVSDPFRFRQILLNLLSNAVKFTEAGQVRLELTHVMISDSKLEILVSVEDSGIGMTAEQQQKLFRDFTQVDGSTTRKYGGTGLGLAISRQLCALLGGTIEVRSELGRGSTFSFRIAASLGKGLSPVNVCQSPDVTPSVPARVASLRVLVAEDNKVNQTIAGQFLKKLNLKADFADNGQAAVDAVKQGTYDVVFMDVHMPTLDGYDATKKIRSELSGNRQPYIVALTANAMKEDKELCLAVGMDDFLKKPLELAELAHVLAKICRLRPVLPKEILSPIFNSEAVLSRFQHDFGIFQHAAALFIPECTQKVAEVRAALDRQDRPSLQKTLHALKGVASYFSTDAVTTVAEEMETLASQGQIAEIEILFVRLKEEAEQLNQAITRFLEEKKSA